MLLLSGLSMGIDKASARHGVPADHGEHRKANGGAAVAGGDQGLRSAGLDQRNDAQQQQRQR